MFSGSSALRNRLPGPKMSIRHAILLLLCLAWGGEARAQVTRIVIDQRVSPAFDGASFGAAGQYETLAGKAYGEIDPDDPRNAVITDIHLAPTNAAGKVEYMATFFLVKPIDMSRSSHLMWQDVPNRGGRITIASAERSFGDVGLSSGWQGDASGSTSPAPNVEYAVVPVARNRDGSPVTGRVMARIVNASGPASRPMIVYQNPVPYRPATLATDSATLTTHASESIAGVVGATATVASGDWAWARCGPDSPFPGTPDPTQICLRAGFDPKLLYQLVFTAKDPYVLGVGFAAFRDVAAFFRSARVDRQGTPNPLAGQLSWVVTRGQSQSGNFLRALLQLGFTVDEAGRRVYDGAWPMIAGRRIALNSRFAMPDGVLTLYEPGSEGPQWWTKWPDPMRGLPASGILDRCTATRSCPRIFENFGAAEVWALKLTPDWVGTSADADIPLPPDVRRYYIPSTQHGGGRGGFSVQPAAPPMCPGAGYGRGTLAANPVPHTETLNALRVHFRNWVMKGTPPPPGRWPTLREGTLVDPTREAMGFPRIPGLPADAPTGLINPLLDYDWGPGFDPTDASGVPSLVPPRIKQVIRTLAPRVDADGNELGGVPVVLRDAPLGTYLGWNITAEGFHAGKICNFAGGMIPFATTRAERMAKGDPRLSLEERYRTHEGYVAAVRTAAAKAVAAGFLLPADAKALIAEASASDVLSR
jgi:hypothetical protein